MRGCPLPLLPGQLSILLSLDDEDFAAFVEWACTKVRDT